MKFPLRFTAPFLMLSSLLWAGNALSHGDNELPLFVAESGADTGDCLDIDNPCGTIRYALSMAGKGGQIRIAKGTYQIDNAEDVFHLVSGVIQVSGGYDLSDQKEFGPRATSTLIGVPFEYREQLSERGFRIVADQKGRENQMAVETEKLLGLHQSLKSSIAATPCTGGSAAGLPCNDVDLLSHVGFVDISATPSAGNDIWGFVDLNTGREYAIAGFNRGTGVFDVSDATNPREVGFVDGQSEVWRDIKVYQYFDAAANRWKAYAYVTTDGSTTDGLYVIDLTGLPHSIRRASYPSDFLSAHNVYAANTDYSTGISLTGDIPTLIVAGSNQSNGRYRAYSLANPEAPAFIPGGTGSGYMHDASSIIITDSRKDTQCVNGGSHCDVLLDFNENTIEIWDISDTANPVQLSNTAYANAGYVHSGWWSEDKQYLFVHDELDERNFILATTLRVFSVSNLANPVLAGTWTGPTNAIDHNGFVRGNRYYMSNYTRGLTVLDITDPTRPVSVGQLDTYPVSDNSGFDGAWGAYPFFHSGNIAISDISSGFYMAADQTRDVPQGKLQFTSASFAADEGQQAQLTVERIGGATGAVSVEYEILHATASASDYSSPTGTLNWAAGDSTNKAINIAAINDGAGESMERLLVRLVSPTGGATLGNLSTTNAYLSDPGASSELNFADASVSIAERGFATIVAVVQRSGSAVGAIAVDLSSTGNAAPGTDYVGTPPATLSWADGDANPKSIEFTVVDDGLLEEAETLSLSLVNAIGASIGATDTFTATIMDGDGANLAPNSIAGISQTRSSGSQVTLDGNQSSDPDGDRLTYQWTQTGGQSVSLNNSGSSVANFTAPTVASDTMLQFRLTVSDPGGLSDSSTTTVTVTKPGSASPSSGSGGGSIGLVTLLLMGVAVIRRRAIPT
jgi:choice-of-anchor B domain-containing protein